MRDPSTTGTHMNVPKNALWTMFLFIVSRMSASVKRKHSKVFLVVEQL